MPGRVLDVLVAEGNSVQKGDTLVLLEAMKMELRIQAPSDGRVARVLCAAGQVVLRRVAASLAQNAMARGKEFLDGMHTLKHTRPDLVAEVRGRGLMLGLVLRDDAEWFRRACLEHRILVNITAGSVVRLLPPLVISSDEVHLALTVFRSVLTSRSS